MRPLALAVLLLLAVFPTTGMSNNPPSAAEILQSAFDTRFNFDVVQIVDLRARSEAGEIRRTLQLATKRVKKSLHGLGYFTAPVEYRGMRILMIERFDRNDDFFVFVPTQGKVRRISSAQRADAFMGTDLTYEDFERRYVADYEIEILGTTSVEKEKVYEIRCSPKYDSGHEYAIYYVSETDHVILRIDFYRKGLETPAKIQRTPRSSMIELDGHVVPTQMWVEDIQRRTQTEVTFSHIHVNPTIPDSMFTRSALEVGRPIPLLPK
jgi:outer membrane lipoprotein-sorting protein